MIAWILLLIAVLYILMKTTETYIYIKDKDTGKTIKLQYGPSGLEEVG